jgi:hypothetical protein
MQKKVFFVPKSGFFQYLGKFSKDFIKIFIILPKFSKNLERY